MSQVHEWFETFAITVSSLNAAKDYLHGVLVSVGFNWRIRECIYGQWYMENSDHPHSNQTAMAVAGAQSRWYIYTRFLLLVYAPQLSWINMRISRVCNEKAKHRQSPLRHWLMAIIPDLSKCKPRLQFCWTESQADIGPCVFHWTPGIEHAS